LGYVFGEASNYIIGAAELAFANPGIKWERTKDLDVGLDLGILSNKLTVTADYYVDKTDNILLAIPIPPSTGSGYPIANAGKMQNKGLELSLKYNSPTYGGGFHFSVNGNISGVRNKVLKLGHKGEIIYGASPYRAAAGPVTEAKVGYPIGAFFMLQPDGLFQSQQAVDHWVNKNGQLLQPQAQPGDVRYLDVNGDGQIGNDDIAYSGSLSLNLAMALTLAPIIKISISRFFYRAKAARKCLTPING
jgi:hypothetical protein